MLLLPGWYHADKIADRLRSSGIECVVEGGDTFFHRDEVRLSMAALRALVEPADTEAVAFLLRGVFGLSHQELAKHRKQDGSLRYSIPGQPPGRVAEALSVLSELHNRRGRKSLSGLLDDLFAETRVLAVWTLLPDGSSRLANVEKLQAMVRKVESETASPYAVVEEMLRIEWNVENKDIDRIDSDGNAVRITSLFKAKGLESPVVVFLEAHRKKSSVHVIVDHENGEVALSLGDLLPPEWERLKTTEDGHQLEERRRFTYVAATRARDQLVVCRPRLLTKKTAKKNEAPERKMRPGCLLGRDVEPRGLPDYNEVEHEATFPFGDAGLATVKALLGDQLAAVVRPVETFPGLDAVIDELLAAGRVGGSGLSGVGPVSLPMGDPVGDKRAAQMKASIKAATKRCVRWRAATTDESSSKWTPGVPVEQGALEGSVGGRGGRVIHSVMERLDLTKPHAVLSPLGFELCGVLGVQAGLLPEKIVACQKIVEGILLNPLIEKARAAPERWHEVPFTYETRPGSVVSGTIDLCFPVNAAKTDWVVFDWKSKVPKKTDALYLRYVEQLKKYATALLKNLGSFGDVKVTDTQIVGPYPELGIVGEPEDFLQDVRGDLRGAVAELIELGVPVPKIGYDVGEPAVTVELLFEEGLAGESFGKGLIVGPELTDDENGALVAQGFLVQRTLILDAETRSLFGLPELPVEDA
jgi:hypothetical protein